MARKVINWPPNTGQIRAYRAGTKRARLIELLSRKGGVTREAAAKDIGWDMRTFGDGLRLVHTSVGYGVREDKKGKLHLVGEGPGAQKPKAKKAKKAKDAPAAEPVTK